MNITLDEWKEWVETDRTQQFLLELEELKREKLNSMYKHLINEREKQAIIESGVVKALEDVITLIHSKKGESANE